MAIGRNPRPVGVILVLADTGLDMMVATLAMHVALRPRMARVPPLAPEAPEVVVPVAVQVVVVVVGGEDLVVDLVAVLAKVRERAKALVPAAAAANPTKSPTYLD